MTSRRLVYLFGLYAIELSPAEITAWNRYVLGQKAATALRIARAQLDSVIMGGQPNLVEAFTCDVLNAEISALELAEKWVDGLELVRDPE